MNTYTKNNVSLNEYQLQEHVYNLNIVNVPKIINYDEDTKIMVMEKIENDNISNVYGELSDDITCEIFEEIRLIINKLYKNGIIYPDITGYNFIEYDNKIWIIDFEHAFYKNYNKDDKKKKNYEDFVIQFISNENNWNPEFK